MKSEIKDIVIDKIENESEYSHLDFKKVQYPIEKSAPKKPELLKDMLAFANLSSKEDKYIIVGIEESNGVATDFAPIDKLNDQATYQQYVNEYIEPEINFEYSEIVHKGHRLAYFRLFDNEKFPYLFKKDLNTAGYRFDIGCGFVRVGTSTRKLKRDDFEKMYNLRHTALKDRKNDLSFRFSTVPFTEPDLRKERYRNIKIDAINSSKKSIEFDVEVRIIKSPQYRVMLTQELERKIEDEKRDATTRSFLHSVSMGISSPSIFLNTYVEHTNNIHYDVFERTPKNQDKVAVKVKQEAKEKDIFNSQIAIFFENPTEVELEITARSDDFVEGPLVSKYTIPKTISLF